MNESAALKSAAVLTKKIPLKSIRFSEEMNPRRDIVRERVSFFQELFQSSDHNVPPLEVLLVQGGDPKSAIYLILDGLHRYEALKVIKAADPLCNVHTEPVYTLSDLEDRKVMGVILEMSCAYNVSSPLPLTRGERIAVAMRFKDLKYSHERIAKAVSVSVPTVNRWLEDKNRQKKEELREEILDELRDGAKVNELARKYKRRVSEFTIMRWRKEADICPEGEGVRKLSNDRNHTPPKGRGKLKPLKPLLPGQDPIPGLTVDDDMHESGERGSQPGMEHREESISKLVKIYDVIRNIEWFDDADDYVISNLLPLVAEKSPKLKKALSIGGYDVLYEEMQSKYEDERKNHAATTATSLEREALIKKLEKELKDRSDHCKYECDYSKEWARKELHRSLGYLLQTVSLLKKALLEGQITDGAKNVIHVPKEAGRALTQVALNAAYIAISHFEWAKLHHVYSPESIAAFYEFLTLLESFEFSKNKDILERIRKVDKAFSSI